MLYHETTFLERDSALAKKTFHSTAKQAGSIAKQSEVGKLLIGHFSARYTENDNTQFIAEVKQEFQNVEIAEELQTFEVG
jgi:ribonuclease Z